MMAFAYCGPKAKQAQPGPGRTMSAVRWLEDKIGDEAFYVLEGLVKSEDADRVPGRALWRINEGTGAEA
jgi:hypothetical protein